jgi:hypothetical protein
VAKEAGQEHARQAVAGLLNQDASPTRTAIEFKPNISIWLGSRGQLLRGVTYSHLTASPNSPGLLTMNLSLVMNGVVLLKVGTL